MWVILPNNADWDCFKTLTSREILKIRNPLLEEQCAFLEVIHLFQQVGCARNKVLFRTVQQNQKSFFRTQDWGWTVYPHLISAIWSSQFFTGTRIRTMIERRVPLWTIVKFVWRRATCTDSFPPVSEMAFVVFFIQYIIVAVQWQLVELIFFLICCRLRSFTADVDLLQPTGGVNRTLSHVTFSRVSQHIF